MRAQESHIKSLECSDELKRELFDYARELTKALGDNLVEVYLYGSLARRCHNPATSDVDIIVITKERCEEQDIPIILQIHRDTAVPVDAVFVTEGQIQNDVFPTPVDFLIKPVSGGKIVQPANGSRDFLLQRQDAYESGILLTEPIPQGLMCPVPWPLIADCLDFLFPHIIPSFKNPALMLCRIAYAWTNHKLCGKKIAGEWAIETFGEKWRSVITVALAEYSSGVTKTEILPATLRAFEDFCTGYIDGLRKE